MKDTTFRIIQILLFVVILIIFIFSLYKVVTITMEYKASRDEYKELENFVQLEDDPEEIMPTPKAPDKETAETQAVKPTATPLEKIEVKYHDKFPAMSVDFASLEAMNSDFVGWLYIPGISLSYPMVLGTDNDYYLTHTFQKEENKSGALFLDQMTANPFEDYNTIVHGHNMKDGSMFAKLKYFYQDTRTYAADPYFYIYTDGKAYKYLIFSYYVTQNTSDTYQIPMVEESYQEYKQYALNCAAYKNVEGIPASAPIVTLSTCHGATYTDLRLVVHGILVATQ